MSLKTLCINHIKRPGNKSGGWQHQTNTAISHCGLFSRVSHRGRGSGCLLWNISHCKGKENLPPGPFNKHGNKWTTVQSITINTDQRAQSGLLFLDAPCGTTFFLARPSHSIFPHSYTNSPLIRSEKCDFQLSLLCFFFFSHPQPPAWC